MKKLLLISNKVMHYRVAIYNHFYHKFKENGWEFIVRSNELQKENKETLEFNFKAIGFKFNCYKKEINILQPDVVILFLHVKDFILWQLVHWLKINNIPAVFWTKGINLNKVNKKPSYYLYRYMHKIFNAIILYSNQELKYISDKNRHKVSVATNTINFGEFPKLYESKEQVKKSLNITFEKIVLFVGSMDDDGGRKKKLGHLIEVFNNIKMTEAGLIIVGSGMSSNLLRKINKNNTIYYGEVHDSNNIQISKMFYMADIFSVPGHLGLALNQAFYWGLPVVTESGVHPPEFHHLIDGRNGFIVEEDNIDQLQSKIIFLLENDYMRQRFSQYAKADIMKHASIDNMFMAFKTCVEKLSKGSLGDSYRHCH